MKLKHDELLSKFACFGSNCKLRHYAKGSATVALVVSTLPETARMIAGDKESLEVALTYYDALPNITLGGAVQVDPALTLLGFNA